MPFKGRGGPRRIANGVCGWVRSGLRFYRPVNFVVPGSIAPAQIAPALVLRQFSALRISSAAGTTGMGSESRCSPASCRGSRRISGLAAALSRLSLEDQPQRAAPPITLSTAAGNSASSCTVRPGPAAGSTAPARYYWVRMHLFNKISSAAGSSSCSTAAGSRQCRRSKCFSALGKAG